MYSSVETNILRRSIQITRISAIYFLFYKLNRYKNEPFGLRVRLACEDLGLVFIKLGQILSTRYDLLEREDCEELQKLLDEVPPVPYEIIKQIFVSDFGKPPEELFKDFDPKYIAAASIAQVYKARLMDGKKVAIKIRRPGVDHAIKSDLRIFRKLAKLAQWFSSDLRHINIDTILGQLESWLIAEVDFKSELKNAEKAKVYYRERGEEVGGEYARAIVFPSMHKQYCSSNILTMDFIEGVPIRQFQIVKNNPQYDVYASLKALMASSIRAWMNQPELVFHGDPHPSNIFILPDGKLALLDFGLLGYFNKKDTEQTRSLFLAVYAQNVDDSVRIGLEMCGVDPDRYAFVIREDIRKYIQDTRFSGMGFWFMGFMHIFMKHRVPLPYQLVLFGRSQLLIEGAFETIVPGRPTLEIIGDELERALRQRIWENVKGTNFSPLLYVLSEKMKKSPEMVAGLVDKYFDDPLQAVRDFSEAAGIRKH